MFGSSVPVRLRQALAATAVSGLLATGAIAVAPGATADTVPPAGTPATVSADALPTPQTNGIVWKVTVVGNRAFAVGNFTTPRNNMLVFDVRNGQLQTFHHTFNAAIMSVAASPDGKRVFVGGLFTTVDGQRRNRFAVFDANNFTLSPIAPSFDGLVRAIAVAPNNNIYIGGDFTTLAGNPRAHVAAIGPNGGLLPWNPGADSNVYGLAISASGRGVYAGGRFSTYGGATRYGFGVVYSDTGRPSPFNSNYGIKAYGPDAAIYSVSSDRNNIYITGYDFRASNGSNFEGRAGYSQAKGAFVFIDDCHGDSYDTFAIGSVLYSASHSHDCTTQNAFPDGAPSHYALASTTYATGTTKHNTQSAYYDFGGLPAPTQLAWYPTFAPGTIQGQSVWGVSGNADYVVYGGEFPSVNGVKQFGLVRFAVRSLTTNKRGPVDPVPAPSVSPQGGGRVSVGWTPTWDQDNGRLVYTIYRDNKAINYATVDTRFWRHGPVAYTDSGVPAGTHGYRLVVSDQTGNVFAGPTTTRVTT